MVKLLVNESGANLRALGPTIHPRNQKVQY